LAGLRAGAAYVDIYPRVGKDFDKDLGRQVDGGVEPAAKRGGNLLGSTLGKAAMAAGGLFAAKVGVDFFKGAIDGASDLNETISKSNTIFGQAGADIEKWSNGAAKTLGQTKQQALDSAATFGNMFTQLGIGSGAAADMSKSMVELGSDFASFHNADISEVLAAQTAAFRGEYDAVQRFVPTINAAAVEQKALEMTGKATTKELTLQEKALATQKLLMEGAGAATGDFARTSDGLANKQRILAAQVEDVKTRLGQALLPAMSAVTGFASDVLLPAFEKVGKFLGDVLGPVFSSFGGKDVDGAAGALSKIAGTVREMVLPVLQQFGTFITTEAIPAITKAAQSVWENLKPALDGLVAAFQRNKPEIEAVLHAIREVAEFIIAKALPVLMQLAGFAARFYVEYLSKLVQGFGAGVRAIQGFSEWLGTASVWLEGFVANITTMPGRIRSAAAGMFDGIKDAFKSAINFIIRGWNRLEFKVPSFEAFGQKLGGFTLGVPDIPVLHSGGVFRAPAGQSEGLALLQDRELVVARRDAMRFQSGELEGGRSGGPLVGEMHVHPSPGMDENALARRMVRQLAWEMKTA
jgi:hypothetical protein